MTEKIESFTGDRFEAAYRFAQGKPRFSDALEFGRNLEHPFSSFIDEVSGELRFGNSTDVEGVMMAYLGKGMYENIVNQILRRNGGEHIHLKGAIEKDGYLVITAQPTWENEPEVTDDETGAIISVDKGTFVTYKLPLNSDGRPANE